MLKFLLIYSLGCILAIVVQEIRLYIFKKKYDIKEVRDSKYFRSSYVLYILTSWLGTITTLFSIIYLKWRKEL